MGEDTDAFEDDAEGPENLLSVVNMRDKYRDKEQRTSDNVDPLHPLNSIVTNGAAMRLPPKLPVVIFQAFSFSLVRGNQRIMIYTTYTLLLM